MIIGGIGSDTIVANSGEGVGSPDGIDVVIGDNGQIVLQRGCRRTNLATLDLVQTINPEAGGGVDNITTGASSDVVIGGDAADTIAAGDGNNIVLGDNGKVSFFGGVRQQAVQHRHRGGRGSARRRRLDHHGHRQRCRDRRPRGATRSTRAPANNVVLGDSGQLDFDPTAAGALKTAISTATAPAFGGDDSITTGVGNDVIIGGIGNDTIVANSGEAVGSPDGVDVVIGDNGQIVYNGGFVGADTDLGDARSRPDDQPGGRRRYRQHHDRRFERCRHRRRRGRHGRGRRRQQHRARRQRHGHVLRRRSPAGCEHRHRGSMRPAHGGDDSDHDRNRKRRRDRRPRRETRSTRAPATTSCWATPVSSTSTRPPPVR